MNAPATTQVARPTLANQRPVANVASTVQVHAATLLSTVAPVVHFMPFQIASKPAAVMSAVQRAARFVPPPPSGLGGRDDLVPVGE